MDQKVTPQYMALKAGMDSVNKEAIAKKVAELTAGTPKDLHEKELQKKRSLEVSMMLQKVMEFSTEQKQNMRSMWARKIQELVQYRPLNKYWAHFDYDMFYVACQLLDQPQYKELPCGVGGDNSVLCTANYAARQWGVRAAMPTFIAKKICPSLILFKPNFQKYQKYSQIFKDTLRKFDQNLQSHGLDQAYVDLTQYVEGKSLKQQQVFLKGIRQEIFDKTGLTVSCGMGPNKMLAKIASDIKKPNDQYIVPNDNEAILAFMKDKPIRKIPGIGPVNEFYLKGLKVETSQGILENTEVLTICFSELSCQYFIQAALGLGCIEHEFKERKSVGRSQTFRPTADPNFINSKIQELCQQVSMDLEELELLTINVVLSYQFENYEKKDKSFKLEKYTTEKSQLSVLALKFLKENILQPQKKVRLLGIRCSQIIKSEEWKRKSLQSYFAREKIKTNFAGDAQGSKTANMLQDIKEASQFICPICNQEIECMNNLARFNRHVDKCLTIGNGQEINGMPKTEIKVQQVSKKSAKEELQTDIKQKKGKKKGTSISGGLQSFLTKKPQ